MHNPDGLACYTACGPCASEWLPGAEPCGCGRWMDVTHASHAPEMVAAGWIMTDPDDGTGIPDVCCIHYHQANWEGGHDGCCGLDGD